MGKAQALSKDTADCTDDAEEPTLSPDEVQAQMEDLARRHRNDLRARLASLPVAFEDDQ